MPTGVAIAAITGGVLAGAGVITIGALTGAAAIFAGAALYGGLAAAAYLLTPSRSLNPGSNLERQAIQRMVRDELSPARWVVGRARVGGDLAYVSDESGEPRFFNEDGTDEGENFLRMILVLSEGPIDAVEKLWIDGVEEHFVRTDRAPQFDPAPRNPNGRVLVPRSSADAGTSGSEYREGVWNSPSRFSRPGDSRSRDAYRIELFLDGAGDHDLELTKPEWAPGKHRLEGVAFVYVELREFKWGSYGQHRRWRQPPELNFLVRGIKIERPTSVDANGKTTFATSWTRNGVAVYRWFLIHRQEVPASKFPSQQYLAAEGVSDQTVNLALPNDPGYDGYATSYDRYAADGVITTDDDPSRVRAELDFAIGGHLVEIDGKIEIRAGVERPLGRAITDDDLVELEGWQPGPDLQDRLNTVSMQLDQAHPAEWTRMAIPEYSDAAAVARDGAALAADLGTRAFVSEPAAALRLAAISLRRARFHAIYSLRLRPGAGFANHGLSPGDRHPLTIERIGLAAVPCEVQSIAINDDLTVSAVFRHSPSGIYEDTAILPPKLPPAPLRAPLPPPDPGPLSTFTAAAGASLTGDVLTGALEVAWTPTLPVQIIVSGPGGFRSRTVAVVPPERIAVPDEGEYTVEGRRIEGDDVGPARTATVSLSWAGVTPPAPPGFAAVPGAVILDDGRIESWLDLSWDLSDPPYSTELAVTGPDGFHETRLVPAGERLQRVIIPGPGSYEVEARHVAGPLRGPAASVQASLAWDALRPSYMVEVIELRQHGSNLQIIAREIDDRAFAGVELRYQRVDIGSATEPGTITDEASWLAAPRFDSVSVLPSLRGQNCFITTLVPSTGRFRIYARAVNRAGLEGPISYLGLFNLVQPTSKEGSYAAGPLWLGLLNNLTPYEQAHHSHPLVLDQDPSPDTPATFNEKVPPERTGGTVMTRARWNGDDGWPFGPFQPDDDGQLNFYLSSTLDLGEVVSVNVRVRPTLWAPPDVQSSATKRRMTFGYNHSTDGSSWTSRWLNAGSGHDAERVDDLGTVVEAGDSVFDDFDSAVTARYLRLKARCKDFNNVGISQITMDYRVAS